MHRYDRVWIHDQGSGHLCQRRHGQGREGGLHEHLRVLGQDRREPDRRAGQGLKKFKDTERGSSASVMSAAQVIFLQNHDVREMADFFRFYIFF